MVPVIGIATSVSTGEGGTRQVLDLRYVEALERAGAAPLLLPLGCGEAAVARVADTIDGLLLTGGNGITDGLVGALPQDLEAEAEVRRDAELTLYGLAGERHLPVLGICYGMQFINARCGGTIYADAMAQAGAGPHSPGRNGGRPVFHEVEVEAGTWLRGLVGGADHGRAAVEVNSFHIQAVSEVGPGLRVGARSPEGLVEAVETGCGGILGVQWHPERMPGTVWDGLFRHLVERARSRAR